ncbi:14110_t:CDS:2, partial [Entrophospora sp. SA101]
AIGKHALLKVEITEAGFTLSLNSTVVDIQSPGSYCPGGYCSKYTYAYF